VRPIRKTFRQTEDCRALFSAWPLPARLRSFLERSAANLSTRYPIATRYRTARGCSNAMGSHTLLGYCWRSQEIIWFQWDKGHYHAYFGVETIDVVRTANVLHLRCTGQATALRTGPLELAASIQFRLRIREGRTRRYPLLSCAFLSLLASDRFQGIPASRSLLQANPETYAPPVASLSLSKTNLHHQPFEARSAGLNVFGVQFSLIP
jgi:hypothetical protein